MYPNLKDKRFTDVSSGKSFSIKDQYENIAILDNNEKVDVRRLLDSNYYEEYIDPKDFFSNSTYNLFADKVKSIPTDVINNMKDIGQSPTSVRILSDDDDERRALEAKASSMVSPQASMQKQYDMLRNIIDGNNDENLVVESFDKPIINNQQLAPQIKQNIISNQTRQEVRQEDPIISMFKNVKRVKDFNITLQVDGKIPRPDFIEMMEDSYEVSLIDFLAEEFTQSILSDPSFIKDKIKEEIRKIVFTKKPRTKKENLDVSNRS